MAFEVFVSHFFQVFYRSIETRRQACIHIQTPYRLWAGNLPIPRRDLYRREGSGGIFGPRTAGRW